MQLISSLLLLLPQVLAFLAPHPKLVARCAQNPDNFQACSQNERTRYLQYSPSGNDEDLFYDDDDFWEEDDEDSQQIARMSEAKNKPFVDKSGASSRQFSLGYDVILSSFAGSSGFEEVTDWEYYMEDEEERRRVVQPPPFDPSKPKRTRESSGSVVRLFRGELVGRIGSTLRSRGLDKRILVKEFSGDMALELAKAELESIGRIQSHLCASASESANAGDWVSSATTRYIMGRANGSTKEDDDHLLKLMEIVTASSGAGVGGKSASKGVPFVGILGELNISEFLEDEESDVRNEWYRALKVPPPQKGSLWLVYEYAGLSTLGNYAQPALKRWSSLPLQKGLFGNPVPPPALPPWRERSKYVVQGVLKGSLEALATLHENGIAHGSIGRNSIIISSVGMDKQEASSPFAIVIPRLRVKLSDFGFSRQFSNLSSDEAFRSRARSFKVDIKKGSPSLAATNFAVAEDLHALGFVFIAVLLSSLAEVPTPQYAIPPTDEDSLQRLLGDIFEKDMEEFREYCEAEDIWTQVVQILDDGDGAGWELLESMCFARESAASNLDNGQILTARGLLSSAFFKNAK